MGSTSIKKGSEIVTTYKSYSEAKIANPACEIVTPSIDSSMPSSMEPMFEVKAEHEIGKFAWVICNPADHCSSLKEFLVAGFKLAKGDYLINIWGDVGVAAGTDGDNLPDGDDYKRYILSATALNGGCKIPAKVEQWTIYNNTIPLCELTDEQYGKMRRAHDIGATVQSLNEDGYGFQDCSSPTWINNGVYRIKPKSERELFIDAAVATFDGRTGLSESAISLAAQLMFDSKKFKYVDLTNSFGESVR
ncbi:MAG: hypothetical protein ACRCUH_15385 [Shewanella sp.]